MNTNRIAALSAAAVLLLGAGGFALYRLGQHSVTAASPAASAAAPTGATEGEEATKRHLASGLKAGETDPVSGRRILYYQDPMVPASRFEKPGKSPFMDMMLVPVYADADSDTGKVTVSPRIQQNLGVRTAVAAEATLAPQLSAVGSIAFNEREQAVIQARATGYVERLHVRATLDRVARGQPLAELYVPDWVAAQQEFLAVRKLQSPDAAALVEGAKARMRLAGMGEEQIRAIESGGNVQPRTTVVAPAGGLVTEIAAREGMAVMPGATLFRINGFATVWANAEVPEAQAALLKPGAAVKAQAPATPGLNYEGRVQALVPDVNAATRTIKARVELANPRGELVPGMFVTLQFGDVRTRKSTVVPSEALIYTGKRTVVILAEDNGRFRPVEVQPGIESGGQTEITQGLQAGQKVVVSSQFLIDSEASLRGVEARLNNEAAPAAAPASASAAKPAASMRYEAQGKFESSDKDAVTLSHGPIAALKWPAMTMEFKLAPGTQVPREIKPGDGVTFEFTMNPDGAQLTRIQPAAQGAKR